MQVCPLCRLTLSETDASCPRDGHAGIPARPADVPAVVRARFHVVQPYAQGTCGDLYLADDQQTGRRGVLKLLRLPANVTPPEKARLKRELVKQATLANPSLAAPLATGDANGVPWVFREWIEGVSLRVRLTRGGALAVPEALAIAAQIASALDELHRAGLLHRDLKPGHVILNPQPHGLPRVSIIDAGIAARIETSSVFDVMGTPEYVSPEQAKGKLVSFRSDLYALGCVLYEMLTGAPPFTGTPAQLLDAHANEPPATPKLELPTNVSTLLAQLLAKEPRERPFSAQQVRRALEPFLPEDASSKREATQTFEKVARGAAAPAPSGTLRPRPGKSTVIGMPAHPSSSPPPPPAATKPQADRTEELSALDLAQAEEITSAVESRPTHGTTNKTLFGIGPVQPSADSTAELTEMDLEDAEEAIATAADVAPFAMPEPSAGAGAPAPPPQAPPWQQTRISDPDDGELAETIAPDREGKPEAASAPARVAPPAAAHPAPAAAAPVAPAPKKKTGVVAVVALGAVLGLCALSILGGAAATWYLLRARSEPTAQAPIVERGEPAPAPEVAAPRVPPPPSPPVLPEVEELAPPPLPPAPPPAVAEPAPPPPPSPPAVARTTEAEERASRAAPRPAEARAQEDDGRSARFQQAREEALAHFQARRFAEAARAYERATELNPRHAGSYAGLGAARLAQGQHDAAIRAYQRAIALSPRHAGYHAALGQAYLASGDRARARESFARALALDPNNQTARQGMQRVGG
ncbi:MAG TPA: protein kinase [Sandaracinaceae bacterium]